jgi:indolepyruvate ferredoxin oxidoreductase beta subunit
MERTNMIFCGLGGQGILFMTRVVAQTAVNNGFHVMGAETHGMAQRGGSVISHLRIGDVESSLVTNGSAHILLALDANECYRNLPFLSNGSRLFVDSGEAPFPTNEVQAFLAKKGIQYHAVAAAAVATRLNAPRSSNLALLGCFSAFQNEAMTSEDMKKTIHDISPELFKEINLRVFDAGYHLGVAEKDRE